MSASLPSALLVGESREPVHLRGPARVALYLDNAALRNIAANARGARPPGTFHLALEQVCSQQEGITLEVYARAGGDDYWIATEGLFGIATASARTESPGLTLNNPLPSDLADVLLEQAQTNDGSTPILELGIRTRLPLPANGTLSIERAALYYEAG